METWMRRIGGKTAMQERQELRLAGKLNATVRRRRKRSDGHKLDCLCAECVPAWQVGELRGLMNGESPPIEVRRR